MNPTIKKILTVVGYVIYVAVAGATIALLLIEFCI